MDSTATCSCVLAFTALIIAAGNNIYGNKCCIGGARIYYDDLHVWFTVSGTSCTDSEGAFRYECPGTWDARSETECCSTMYDRTCCRTPASGGTGSSTIMYVYCIRKPDICTPHLRQIVHSGLHTIPQVLSLQSPPSSFCYITIMPNIQLEILYSKRLLAIFSE